MKKDTYYFSHDANAKDDPKCMALIDDLGMEGYGIFWVLIEILRSQPDYKCPLSVLKSISRQYNTTLPKVEVVVKNYGLFSIENNEFFYSESLLNRMRIADAKRLKLSEAGKRGNSIKYGVLSPPDSHPIATRSQLKEIKGNKSKLNKSKIEVNIPTWEEFKNYVLEQKPEIDISALESKYKSWKENDWKTGHDKKIKNWKSTILNTISYLPTKKIEINQTKHFSNVKYE